MKKTRPWLTQLSKVESQNITYVDDDFPVILKKGSGVHLWDVDGHKYNDFTSCFGVAALGHRPEVVLTAMRKQAAKLICGMGDVHPTESKIRFLTLLGQMLPYARPNTILSSTGSEAVETALKTAVLATKRNRFISFEGGYHGLMTGPLRLNNRAHFTSSFESWLETTATVLPFPIGDEVTTRLEDELKKKTYAAIVMEPIQGRGGDRCFPKQFVVDAFALAKKYDTLVIFDEVFSGFGRTGSLFAFEDLKVVPDILCLGKAMGGGLPLSACVGDVLEVWGKSTGEARHTSTFLGHPLACATGHATIKEIRARLPDFNKELVKIDAEFQKFASDQDRFKVNGAGFMRGLHFFKDEPGFAFELTKKLLKRGFITLPSGERGDVLSLTPPLITKATDYRRLFKAIDSHLTTK
jgi:4-aminobutyrate aminotransferase-like enzyme